MEYRIPDGISTIDKEWIKQHIDKNVTKVICPSSLKIIVSNAFCGYKNLGEIILNEGLEYIGENAFRYCNLKKIIVPSTVEIICPYAFSIDSGYFISSLEEIIIKNGVKEIDKYAFGGVHLNLKRIIIPNSVEFISRNAFAAELNFIYPEDYLVYTTADRLVLRGEVIIGSESPVAMWGKGKLKKIFSSNVKIIIKNLNDGIDYNLFSNIKKVSDEEKYKLGLELFDEINKNDIDLDKVQELLINGADTEMRDNDDNTGLMLMIKKGNNEISMMYLLSGCDINARNKLKETPLILASRSNANDIAFELIKRNCIINAMTVFDESALSIAYDNGNIELVSRLEDILNISSKERELNKVAKVRRKVLGG